MILTSEVYIDVNWDCRYCDAKHTEKAYIYDLRIGDGHCRDCDKCGRTNFLKFKEPRDGEDY